MTKHPVARIIGLLVILAAILAILSFWPISQKKKPSPTPKPTLTWLSYTSEALGISFSYPKTGEAIMENKQKLADGTIIEVPQSVFVTVPVTCEFEKQGYFVVEVSDSPPDLELLSYLTRPQVVGGKEGKGSTYVPRDLQSDGRDSEMILVEEKGRYYLIKDETCTSELGKQILNSFRFL